jgi:hypothetical protein
MPTLKLSDEQVIDLVKQLPKEQQDRLFEYLLVKDSPVWDEMTRYGEERARQVAAGRGQNWDAMTEEEKEDFVNELVHEDRHCSTP